MKAVERVCCRSTLVNIDSISLSKISIDKFVFGVDSSVRKATSLSPTVLRQKLVKVA
jgi:hypothetical protein